MAVAFIEAITKSVLDDNFMRGTKDMLDAIYHPAEYGERYVQDFATNWLPYSVGLSQVARQIDPYQRQIKDLDFWSQTFDDISGVCRSGPKRSRPGLICSAIQFRTARHCLIIH